MPRNGCPLVTAVIGPRPELTVGEGGGEHEKREERVKRRTRKEKNEKSKKNKKKR